MASYKFLVISNATPGKDAEFNDWYDNRHIPDLLKMPGFVGAKRFKVMGETSLPGQYVTIYEMETDDPQATLENMMSKSGTDEMIMTDAIDISNVSTTLLAPVP